MSEYTRGPWHVFNHPRGGLEIRAGDISLADLRWNGHNEGMRGLANARLMAAAPRLLAFVRSVAIMNPHPNSDRGNDARALLRELGED